MSKKKTVVITGATGSIALALIEKLHEEGVTIYAVCRPNSNRKAVLVKQNKATIIECDIAHFSNLSTLINDDVDIFFHFAWENTIGVDARNNMDSQIANIKYTIDAVRAAKDLGCHTFIGAGSQAEYGRTQDSLTAHTPTFPENGYGMAKLCAGQMSKIEAQKMGLKHIWTRILSVYGPNDNVNTFTTSAIRSLLKGESFKCTKCEQIWDYIFTEDIARAFSLIAQKGKDGSIYPIGTGIKRPISDYLEEIKNCINSKLKIDYGAVPYFENQVMYLSADISQLTKDTGFVPQVQFKDGIKKTIDWVKGVYSE